MIIPIPHSISLGRVINRSVNIFLLIIKQIRVIYPFFFVSQAKSKSLRHTYTIALAGVAGSQCRKTPAVPEGSSIFELDDFFDDFKVVVAWSNVSCIRRKYN